MRGSFNSTVDVVKGPGSAFPGLFVGTYDCRLVVEDAISTVGVNPPVIPAYMTIAEYQPTGAWTAPYFGMDARKSDQLAIPSGAAYTWWVLYTDLIVWFELTPYFRSYLVQLPLPSTGPFGGLLGAGQAIVHVTHPLVGTGGLLGDSGAELRLEKHLLAQGGAILDSRATWRKRDYLFGVGGAIADSSAGVSFRSQHEGHGGMLADYNAVLRYFRSIVPAGGAIGNSAGEWNYAGSGFPAHGTIVYTDDPGAPGPRIRAVCGSPHGLSGGEVVTVAGCVNDVGANGTWTIAFNTVLDFYLLGATFVGPGGSEPSATWTL